MPMYDYQCPDCMHQFEVKQSFNDEPYSICPYCEAVSRRVFHPVPIIYKGSGFYTTDYARKDRSAADITDNQKSRSAGNTTKVPATAADD